MYVSQVEDKDAVPPVRYRISPDGKLGAGATADVWRGRAMDTGTEVAIKIASQVDPPSEAAFWAEYELLHQLAGTEALDNVPWVHRGSAPGVTNAILIMEMAHAEWQLSRHEIDGRLPESVALPAGVQYALLLKSLHTLGYSTRGDRKATDLRWDAEKSRLIVLDWNRAERMPTTGANDVRVELIQQDIAGFGQLWADRLLGRQFDRAPISGEDAPAEWTHVSRGFRRILARSLGQSGLLPYANAGELFDDLKTLDAQQQTAVASKGQQSLQAALALKRQAEAGDAALAAGLADTALDLLDLAERAAGKGELPPEQTEALKQWAAGALNTPEVEVHRAIRRARALMLQQNYRQAIQTLDEVLEHQKSNARLVLQLWRWQLIAVAARDGNEQGLAMTGVHAPMTTAIEKLEDAAREQPESGAAQVDLHLAEKSLNAAMAGLDHDDVREKFKPLQMEILIRRALSEKPPAPEVATSYFAQLRKQDAFYAAQLRQSEPALHTAIQQTLTTDAMSAARNNDLRAFVELAQQALATPMDEATGLQAHRAYLGLGQRKHTLTQQDQALCTALLWLRDVQDCLNRHQPADAYQMARVAPAPALEALSQLAAARNTLLEATGQAVIQGVHATMQDALLPGELRTCIDGLGVLVEPSAVQVEARALLEELTRRRESTRALSTELLGLLNGAQVVTGDAGRPVQPDDFCFTTLPDLDHILDLALPARVDGILREAQQKQIELFDVDPSIEGAGVWRVKSLLSGRSGKRVLDRTIAFKAALLDLTNVLREQEGGEQETLRILGAWDGVQQLAQTEASIGLGSNIATLEDLADRWVKLQPLLPQQEQVQKMTALVSVLDDEIKPAEIQLKNLNAKADAIDRAGALLITERVQHATTEMENARSAIRRVCILQGLQAIRELNLTDAQTMLKNIEQIQPINSVYSEPEVNLLKTGTVWLQAVEAKPNLSATIAAWRQALRLQNAKDAAEKRSAFWQRCAGDVQVQQHWVIGELELHHAALLAAQAPTVSGVPAQSDEAPAAVAQFLYRGIEALRDMVLTRSDSRLYILLGNRQITGNYLAQALLLDWRSQVLWALDTCDHTSWLLKDAETTDRRNAGWAIWLLQESFFHLAGVLNRLSPVSFSLCFEEWKKSVESLIQSHHRWQIDAQSTRDLIKRGTEHCKRGEGIIDVYRRQTEIVASQAATPAPK